MRGLAHPRFRHGGPIRGGHDALPRGILKDRVLSCTVDSLPVRDLNEASNAGPATNPVLIDQILTAVSTGANQIRFSFRIPYQMAAPAGSDQCEVIFVMSE